MKSNASVGNQPGQRPWILVFGLPRSGTSWLGKLLDSSESTFYLHEPDSGILSRRLPIYINPLLIESNSEKCLRKFLHGLPGEARPQAFIKKPIFSKKFYSRADRWKLESVFAFRVLCPSLSAKVRLSRLLDIGCHVPVVIKSVESFGRIPLFLKILSKYKIVFIIRHPCGVINSIMRGESKSKFKCNRSIAYSVDRLRQLCDLSQAKEYGIDLNHLMALPPVQRVAYWWLLSNEKAIEECQRCENARVIVYEDLFESPLDKAKEIYDFLGLEFTGQSEQYIRDSTRYHKQAYYSIYKDPKRVMKAWKHELDPDDKARILDILRRSELRTLWMD